MFQLVQIITVCSIEFNLIIREEDKRIRQQRLIIMGINAILQQISKFFSAVLTTYTQLLPRDLKEQIKTMQAFLRSYDQKQLFLIQNFVRRIESKTQKSRYLNQRKTMKTQPDYSPLLNNHQNKQNEFNFINVFNRNGNENNYRIDNYNDNVKEELRNNDSQEDNSYRVNRIRQRVGSYEVVEQQQDREMVRYRDMFSHYARNNNPTVVQDNYHSSLQRPSSILSFIDRPLSIPKDRSYISKPDIYSSRDQVIKPRSSPYLQLSTDDSKVKCSTGCIQQDFANIQIPQQFKLKQKSQDNNSESEFILQTSNMDLIMTTMRRNASELKEMLQSNRDVVTLKQFIGMGQN